MYDGILDVDIQMLRKYIHPNLPLNYTKFLFFREDTH